MLKLSPSGSESFHNFKCGEIFCITAAVFNVSCCLCGSKMHLEQFPSHFQIHHLTQAEECINYEEVDKRKRKNLSEEQSLLENITIKEEEPEDDPIKQEDEISGLGNVATDIVANCVSIGNDDEDDEDDDKCLQEIIIEAKRKQAIKNTHSSNANELGNKTASRKHLTRNAKRSNELNKGISKKASSPSQDNKIDIKVDVTPMMVEILKEDVSCDDDDVEGEDFHDDDDKEWAAENNVSEVDSDPDKDTNDELPFPCLICKRSYRSKHSLQKHNSSVHNPNKPVRKTKESKPQHKCDECDEVFRSARDLRGHKWKHTGIFCDICGKPFTQAGNMMLHKIRHTGIKAHKCKECNKDFFTSKELKSHMICHTGVMPVICEICGKRCRDRGVLTAHMRRHTGERPAKCNVCGKSFFSYHDLNVHAVTHSSERPFKCDVCGSTFQRKKALRVHKLIHSKDRKHVCKVCGKGFAQSGGLNSHMRTHDAAVTGSNEEASTVNCGVAFLCVK